MVEVSTLQTILRSHQNLEEKVRIEIEEEEEEKNSQTRDTAAELLSVAFREAKLKATIIETETNTATSESIELLQQHLDDATISADQRLNFKQKQQHFQVSKSAEEISEKLGYQLRALRNDISALESNPWLQAPTLPNIIQASTLSSELVNETLNYFVNCGQRLSQMTKTYDDNDAYMLLLQEKEVDLELAARIGQDLLKQNKQLKDSIKNLEHELAQRQNDLQQLRHELSSKISLLDTFIEEEEHQTSLVESLSDSTYRHQEQLNSNNVNKQPVLNQQHPPTLPDFEDCSTGFLSLNCNHQNQPKTIPEPFSSLPSHLVNSQKVEPSSQLTRDDSASSICDDLNSSIAKPNNQQQNLVQTVTIQLVESNKRLCELQDELFYKGEQNLSRQEKIYQLQQQLGETERRLGDVASENENLHRSIVESAKAQNDLSEELKTCRRNFDELLAVFLELQKESRTLRLREMRPNSNVSYYNDLGQLDGNNISYEAYNDANPPYDIVNQHENLHHHHNDNNNNMLMASLLDELEGSIRNHGGTSDGDATDGTDSGVHASHRSYSDSPSANVIVSDSDGEELGGKKSWIGLSSFMLTTILLLCLSATLSSASSFDLTPKVNFKLEK